MKTWRLPVIPGSRGQLTVRAAGDLVEVIVDGRAVVDAHQLDAVCLEYLEHRGVLRPGWYTEARIWSDDNPPLQRGWEGQHVNSTPMRSLDEAHARKQLAWNNQHMVITQNRLLVRLETRYHPVEGAVTRPHAVPEDQFDIPWEDPNR